MAAHAIAMAAHAAASHSIPIISDTLGHAVLGSSEAVHLSIIGVPLGVDAVPSTPLWPLHASHATVSHAAVSHAAMTAIARSSHATMAAHARASHATMAAHAGASHATMAARARASHATMTVLAEFV